MTQRLVVLLGGERAGEVMRDGERLTLAYDDAWRFRRDACPMSLSLPLAAHDHPSATLEAFLWGLLPEDEQVLQRWGKRFHVSPRNPFRLLAHVGEDCAGAVQLVEPERVEALTAPNASGVEWLTNDEVADRLRHLQRDASASRLGGDTGQFSLAGAQPKIALLHDGTRWGVPFGAMPTTHILKPPMAQLPGHAQVEHACLRLARELGLAAARTEVVDFAGEEAIVIERFDRTGVGTATLARLHQEDVCQALGVMPMRKYQAEGGPTPKDVANLLRNHSSRPQRDVERFRDALLLNALIGGTDAHAKNYSLLITPGPRVRLAPLYDVASALPFPELEPKRLKLAMKLGSTYRLRDMGRAQVEGMARELELDPEKTRTRAGELAASICERLPPLAEELDVEVVHRLAQSVREHIDRMPL